MKWKFYYYVLPLLSLVGCEHAPIHDTINLHSTQSDEFEQLIVYGEKFTLAFEKKPIPTCRQYIQRHREGDWRAAWVLALAVAKKNSALCLNTKDAIYALTSLTRQKKMPSHFTWLTQFHLRQLRLLQKRDEKISQLKKSGDQHKKNIAELKLENLSLSKKLKALKAIEIKINQ